MAKECNHKQRHWALNLLDTGGVIASGACAVHCFLTPIFLALAPAAGGLFAHSAVHVAMFTIVLPLALITLGFSTWRSKQWTLLLIGLLGCALLAFGLELEHNHAPGWNSPATWANICGGIILAAAHVTNFRRRATHEYC